MKRFEKAQSGAKQNFEKPQKYSTSNESMIRNIDRPAPYLKTARRRNTVTEFGIISTVSDHEGFIATRNNIELQFDKCAVILPPAYGKNLLQYKRSAKAIDDELGACASVDKYEMADNLQMNPDGTFKLYPGDNLRRYLEHHQTVQFEVDEQLWGNRYVQVN